MITTERSLQQLSARLAHEHARDPFRPSAPREAARRVLAVAQDGGLDALLVRGGVDVGPVEVDHLWARVEGWVVDVTLPLFAHGFRAVLHQWVAGDVDNLTLDVAAEAHGLDLRVVARVPDDCAYRGRPVLHHRRT